MKYDMEDIEYYVREVLGSGYLRGLFISNDAVTGDLSVEDADIITNFSPLTFLQSYHGYNNYDVYMGMTKLVIRPKKANYVIKIPFTGYYNYNYNEYNNDFEEFYLGHEREHSNCCDQEMALYEDATEQLRNILLPIEFVGMIDGLKIYIQEKYKTDFDGYEFNMESDAEEKKSTSAQKKICSKISEETKTALSDIFVGLLIQEYGIKNTIDMLEEIEDLEIYDLHSGNYGFGRDNRCVIFDYAGYTDDYYCDE